MLTESYSKKLKGKDYLGHLGVDGRTAAKQNIKDVRQWIHLARDSVK
jgi:hypothetical protein